MNPQNWGVLIFIAIMGLPVSAIVWAFAISVVMETFRRGK